MSVSMRSIPSIEKEGGRRDADLEFGRRINPEDIVVWLRWRFHEIEDSEYSDQLEGCAETPTEFRGFLNLETVCVTGSPSDNSAS